MVDPVMWERSDPLLTGYKLPLQRYAWAVERLGPSARLVADAACGCGYGTQALARAGYSAVGFDASREALRHIRAHGYEGAFVLTDLGLQTFRGFDALVCLETIEHLVDPEVFVKNLEVPRLLISTTTLEPGVDEWHKHTMTADRLRALVTPMFEILAEFPQVEPCGIGGREEYLMLDCRRCA